MEFGGARGMTSEKKTHAPRSFVLFAWVALFAGVALQYLSLGALPVGITPELLLVIAAAAVTENYAFRYGTYSVSLAFPMVVAAMTIAGPAGAGLAAAVSSTNLPDLRSGRPLSYTVFNVGQVLFSACLGGWVYVWLGGTLMQFTGSNPTFVPLTLAAVVAAGAVYSLANMCLTAMGSWLATGTPPLQVLSAMVQYAPTQFALSLVGFLVAQVIDVSMLALPLFLFPLLLARQTYQRYAGMHEAYVDTVRSLVKALEAKDPYTRGHSQRVAEYASQIALELRLDSRSREALEKAALLHDIGKLAIPSDILKKPGKLNGRELSEIRMHPARGAAMIGKIPPLRSLQESVGAHHEKLDATGYPRGLAGDDIPLMARILAVADAYDAMTTDRAYRGAMSHSDAVMELRAGIGSQFDGEVVHALIAVDATAVRTGLSDAVTVGRQVIENA